MVGKCRSPHGERGLKYSKSFCILIPPIVALPTESVGLKLPCTALYRVWIRIALPHGERGLKFRRPGERRRKAVALPTESVIEIFCGGGQPCGRWSLSPRRAWIEIKGGERYKGLDCVALPHGEAWIEISRWQISSACRQVALPHGERGLKSCVPRVIPPPAVALPTESVD